MTSDIKYGLIILAAGNSSRLGRSKQLLQWKDSSFIKHIAQEASGVPGCIAMVITGADREAVETELKDTTIVLSHNADWQSGMSSSIHKGIIQLQSNYPDIEGTIIAVCDQPYITNELFLGLLTTHEHTGFGIVASSYADTAGTPVFFSKNYFEELLLLTGQEGAKKLLAKYEANVSYLPFPNGEVDVDTDADYNRLIASTT